MSTNVIDKPLKHGRSQSEPDSQQIVSSDHYLDGDCLEMNDEFVGILDRLENTSRCIFVTGKAGTGKSTLLKYFKKHTKKNIVVLAPTGIAAINVQGQTIHSFFKFPPKLIHAADIKKKKNGKMLKKLDAIIIDEVSMVRADIMEAIDRMLRLNRNQLDTPFGGVQMIFFGDLFQLSPVVERDIRDIYAERYLTPFFFSAGVFSELELEKLELTRIYRQTNSEYINFLEKIRNGNITLPDLEFINSRVSLTQLVPDETVTLTATNALASRINSERLNSLESKEYEYVMDITGEITVSSMPTEAVLKLRRGAQVILTRNDRFKRWVNGNIGIIEDLSEDFIKVRIKDMVYEVERETWEKIEYKYNDKLKKIEDNVVGTFEQYPIKLAWALTIHKSQGQSFDNVIIDLMDRTFAHGQLYVALSRCRNLEGLILKRPVSFRDMVFDKNVMSYLNGNN